jgi:hypothetical protein
VVIAVVVVILEESSLIGAVARESNAGDAEAREDTLESVESAEGAVVSPRLTAEIVSLEHQVSTG